MIGPRQILCLSGSSGDDYGRLMPRRMTIAGQIEQSIEALEGASICDDGITDQFNLLVRSQANVVTRGLGDNKTSQRGKASCSHCGSIKTVVRHNTP